MANDYIQAYRALRKDPVMKRIISKTGTFRPFKNYDLYFALLRSITNQQLSAKAGDTIFGRFLDLFPGRAPVPELLLDLHVDQLRGVGLSYAKASYLKNIATFSLAGGLDFRKLRKLEDDELINHLTAIKGVGRWTSEMILIFSLNRLDVLPLDDIVIRNEMVRQYGIKGSGKILVRRMANIAEQWRPYRSLACRHLWHYRDK